MSVLMNGNGGRSKDLVLAVLTDNIKGFLTIKLISIIPNATVRE